MDPALARMTNAMASSSRTPSCSPSSRKATSAAAAGSRLIRIPKVACDIRCRARISKVNGMAELSSPSTSPMPQMPGSRAQEY